MKLDIAEAFGATDITTDAMKNAIADWYQLYYNTAVEKGEDPCQEIAFTIVSKLSKTCFSEYQATSTSNSKFVQDAINALNKKRKKAVQAALIGGESRIKPIPTKTGFRFAIVDRRNMNVFGRDGEGEITDVGTIEKSTSGNAFYTLLERRTVDGNGYLTITNKLYKSLNKGSLGQPVPLDSLPQYADMEERYVFQVPIGSIGMAPLRVPMVNCVDGSQDAVSVYAKAARLIHNININEGQLNGEFERGESRILASSDLLSDVTTGNSQIDIDRYERRKKLNAHVFTMLDGDPDEMGITIFSPQLRDQSFLARKTEYMRNVENIIGLKRGLLSEVEAADRTATEITSSEGDYALTISDLQEAWEEALKETLRLCGILGTLYHVHGAMDIDPEDIAVDWGNGVLYDRDKRWQELKDMVSMGLLMPEKAVGWYFNLPRETDADLEQIRKDYMPQVRKMMEE